MSLVESARIDRSFFEIGKLGEEGNDTCYWRSRTPEERMLALELLRQIYYGYDPASTRLQRVFEVAELE